MVATPEAVREWLRGVPDPEIPHVSIVDMGLIRGVEITDRQVKVKIVPTFAGCPAIRLLQEQIRQVIEEKGLTAMVEADYAQPWKAEYMSEAAWEGCAERALPSPRSSPKTLGKCSAQLAALGVTLSGKLSLSI